MTFLYACKVFTDTVDLFKQKTFKFKIQEPPGVFFYINEIKLTCLQLDSGESQMRAKPGKIIRERILREHIQGKDIEIEYEPDKKTFPGKYRLEVIFKRKPGNGQNQEVCNQLAEFRVVDSTPISICDSAGKTIYNIDLSDTGDTWKKPVELKVVGPRNQEIELEYTFAGEPVSSYPVSTKEPYLAGKFNKNAIKLTGDGTKDRVIYYPGTSATRGKVVITALSKKTKDKAQFTIIFKDIDCEVYFDGRPINNEQTLPVRLEHSRSTAHFDDGFKYTTILSSKFAFFVSKHAKVSIRMSWNGYGCGHTHDLASHDKLATGYFFGFTQEGEFWVPGVNLTQTDGTVNFRDIDYVNYGLSGIITVEVLFKLPGRMNRDKKIRFYLSVFYPGLTQMQVSEDDNIKLVGDTTTHPDNQYGTQKLIDAIKKVAKAYGEACNMGEFDIKGVRPEGDLKKLHVNDMSLAKGGRFDYEATLKPPHQEHVFGEEVDISISASKMNTKQLKWLHVNGKKHGFLRFEPEPDLNPTHFHCSTVPRD